MTKIHIYLANKNYSSWSLRAWLALKQTGVEFAETVIPLREADTAENIRRYSPSGKLPALVHGEETIWDSLSICEYLAEAFPKEGLWPEDAVTRAQARSVSNEMHSGFLNLRRAMPMNMRSAFPGEEMTPEVREDVNRITAIWHQCRKKYGAGGDFLFGKFCIADAMFAPIVSRFATYGVELDKRSEQYAEAILGHPHMKEWSEAAKKESWIIPDFEF